jgi:hypothetical protein
MINFELVQILKRIDKRCRYARGNTTFINSHATLALVLRGHQSWENSHANSRFSTLMQLLFSFDRGIICSWIIITCTEDVLEYAIYYKSIQLFNRDLKMQKVALHRRQNMLVQKWFNDSSIVSINETQILIEQKKFLPYRVAKLITSFESETERLSLRQNNL